MKVDEAVNDFVPPSEIDFHQPSREAAEKTLATFPCEGRLRVVIENITPKIDEGRYSIKRTPGERVVVEADLFADSHVLLSGVIKYRPEDRTEWLESPMVRLSNDRWQGEFIVTDIGIYFYTIEAWVDRFKSWREDLRKKIDAGQDVAVDLMAGAELIGSAASRIGGATGERLATTRGTIRCRL
jgi:starch synthase (maltosyl-transferring)